MNSDIRAQLFLWNILKAFSKATKHVSSAQIPILAISIPIYDWLMDRLEESQGSIKTSLEMKAAIESGMLKIKDYYKKTDDCSLYTIATGKLLLLIYCLFILLIFF